jgi:small-conductance mechanosensitive channel
MNSAKLSDIFQTIDSTTLLELALILGSSIVCILLLQKLLPWLADHLHGKRRLFVLALVPFFRLLIIIVALLLSVPLIIEPSLQNMVALLGSLGLALGFALKDYASSLIAGIVAVGERPYSNGDWIEVGGIYGEVTHVGVRTVQIRTPDDTLVHIPHLKLWNEMIANANSGSPRLQVVVDFYLHPRHDGARVRELLHDVALASPFVCLDEPVAVIVREDPWGSHYRLKAYPVDSRQQFRMISDLTVGGKAVFIDQGIDFATANVSASPEPN